MLWRRRFNIGGVIKIRWMRRLFAIALIIVALMSLSLTEAQAQEESRIEIHSVTFFLNSSEIGVKVDYNLESFTEISVKIFGDAPIKREIQKLFLSESIEFVRVSQSEVFVKLKGHRSILEPVLFDREIKDVSFVFSDGTKITVHNRTVTPRIFF